MSASERVVAVVFAWIGALTSPAWTQTAWMAPDDGNWGNPANWSVRVPNADDTGVFNNAGAGLMVNLQDANQPVHQLLFDQTGGYVLDSGLLDLCAHSVTAAAPRITHRSGGENTIAAGIRAAELALEVTAGTLKLVGDNSQIASGTATVDHAALWVEGSSGLGAMSVSLSDGVLEFPAAYANAATNVTAGGASAIATPAGVALGTLTMLPDATLSAPQAGAIGFAGTSFQGGATFDGVGEMRLGLASNDSGGDMLLTKRGSGVVWFNDANSGALMGNTSLRVEDGTVRVTWKDGNTALKPASVTLIGGKLELAGGPNRPGQAGQGAGAPLEGILTYHSFNNDDAVDDSGNGHDGVLVGAVPADGKEGLGRAMYFAGDQYIEDPDGEEYINGLTAFTVAMWIKADSIPQNRAFFTTGPCGDADKFLTIRYDSAGATAGGTNVFKMGVSTTTTGSGNTPHQLETSSGKQTTQWQHVALTWTSLDGNGDGQLRFYIDGDLDTPTAGGTATSGGTISFSEYVRVGDGAKDQWLGLLDEVYLYDRALEPEEIVKVRDATGLLPPYPFVDYGMPINLEADSVLGIADMVGVGSVTLKNNADLSVVGDGEVYFNRLFVDEETSSVAVVNVDANATVFVKRYDSKDAVMAITKDGDGALVFDGSMPGGDTNTTFRLAGGSLGIVRTALHNPLPNAAFEIDGGALVISSKDGGDLTFRNAWSVSPAGGSIEARKLTGQEPDATPTITLSGDADVAAGGVVSLRTDNAHRLVLHGDLGGAGGVAVVGTVDVDGAIDVGGDVGVSGLLSAHVLRAAELTVDGEAQIDGNANVTSADLSGLLNIGGALQAASTVTVRGGTTTVNGETRVGGLVVDTATFEAIQSLTASGDVETNGTLTVGGALAAGSLRVTAGSLTVDGALTTDGNAELAGTVTVGGPVDTADLTITAGRLDAASTLTARALTSGANVTVQGLVDVESLRVTGRTFQAGQEVHASTGVRVEGGTATVDGLLTTPQVEVAGGVLEVPAGLAGTPDVTVSAGELNLPGSLTASTVSVTGGLLDVPGHLDAQQLRLLGGQVTVGERLSVPHADKDDSANLTIDGGTLWVSQPDALADLPNLTLQATTLGSWLKLGAPLVSASRPVITVEAGSLLSGETGGLDFQDAAGYATDPRPGVDVVLHDGAVFGGTVEPTTLHLGAANAGDPGGARLAKAIVGGDFGETITIGDDPAKTDDIYLSATFGPWTEKPFIGQIDEATPGSGLEINLNGMEVEVGAWARFITVNTETGVNFVGPGTLRLPTTFYPTVCAVASRTAPDDGSHVNRDILVLGKDAIYDGMHFKAHNGRVVVTSSDTLKATGTLSLFGPSSLVLEGAQPSRGTLNVPSGCMIWTDVADALAGGATWNIDPGVLFVYRSDDMDPLAGAWPTGLHFVAEADWCDTFVNSPLAVSQGAYLLTTRDRDARIDGDGMGVGAAPGAAPGQAVGIAAAAGRSYLLRDAVDLGFEHGGETHHLGVIVGGDGPMETTVGNGNRDRVEAEMTGTVRVEGIFRVGDVDVRSGRLALDSNAGVSMGTVTVRSRLDVLDGNAECADLVLDGGVVALAGGTLRVRDGSLASVLDGIRQAYNRQPGEAFGDWSGTGGITCPLAVAEPDRMAVGVREDVDGVLLQATACGDVDLDGTVGRGDFVALRAGFDQPGSWPNGDLNYDGQVNFLDYIAMKRNVGGTFGAGAAPIPEPAGLCLLALGGAALLRRRRS